MCGGEPKYLSLSLIIEEGFNTGDLVKIIQSIKATSEECGVKIVTGDTKVVERGKGDGIYINTAGIGFLRHDSLGEDRIREGDAVIVSGTMGDHGIAVMAARNNLIISSNLESDCTPLHRLSEELMKYKDALRVMRDPTRGGLATTLNEFTEHLKLGIELVEDDIPVRESVKNACEILGLDPLYSANEGKIVLIADYDKAEDIVKSLKHFPEGRDAALIGRVTSKYPNKVVIKTFIGGTRILSKLTGAQLPRIC
jgi:hydrogenase expression/formation protein HypE